MRGWIDVTVPRQGIFEVTARKSATPVDPAVDPSDAAGSDRRRR